jgi:hypothetical protein
MNAELLWLAWQADGSDVPIELCQLIEDTNAEWMQNTLIVNRNTGYIVHNSNAHKGPAVILVERGVPLPLDKAKRRSLARWVCRVYAANRDDAAHPQGMKRLELVRAARAWVEKNGVKLGAFVL